MTPRPMAAAFHYGYSDEFAGGTMRVITAGFCQRDLTARRAISFHIDLAGR